MIKLDYDSVELKNEPDAILVCALLSKIIYEGKDTFTKKSTAMLKKQSTTFKILRRNKMTCIVMSFDDTFYIGFKGTSNNKDIFSDIKASSTSDFYGSHVGFLRAAHSILPDLLQYFESIKAYTVMKDVIITGHSLGGATAQIMSIIMNYADSDINIYCVTFGGPKPGKKEFVDKFQSSIWDCISFQNSKDPVPKLPPSPFEHPCKNIIKLKCGLGKRKIITGSCHTMNLYLENVSNWVLETYPNNNLAKSILKELEVNN